MSTPKSISAYQYQEYSFLFGVIFIRIFIRPGSWINYSLVTSMYFNFGYPLLSRYRKLEIQLRMKTDSLYLTTPNHSGGEDKLAVQVQTPEHSGGADIIGSAGAVNPAVQSLQLGQRIQSSPHPSGKY